LLYSTIFKAALAHHIALQFLRDIDCDGGWTGGADGEILTSGTSCLFSFSSISHSTSTGVLGFIAMPACMPSLCMNLMSSLGDVFLSDFPLGESAAVEEAAS
jgi:hypothetical protein